MCILCITLIELAHRRTFQKWYFFLIEFKANCINGTRIEYQVRKSIKKIVKRPKCAYTMQSANLICLILGLSKKHTKFNFRHVDLFKNLFQMWMMIQWYMQSNCCTQNWNTNSFWQNKWPWLNHWRIWQLTRKIQAFLHRNMPTFWTMLTFWCKNLRGNQLNLKGSMVIWLTMFFLITFKFTYAWD